jgi:hypothetical protein
LNGASKQTLKVLANGGTGTGKTYLAFTFPKVAYIGTEPNGIDTAKANPELLENLVYADEFIPSPTEDIKVTFERMDAFLTQAHKDAVEGKVETLVLDNVTFLSENRWMFINQHQKLVTAQGALDTRGMYGTLSRWLYQFTLTKILSFKGNVVVTCHEQIEGEDAMERKVDKTTPVVPNILGGFREKIAGMFSASIYLEKKRSNDGKYSYIARCQKGNMRDAKNRYNLPEIVENVSYKSILGSINIGTTAKQ